MPRALLIAEIPKHDLYKNKRPVSCFHKKRGVTLATSYFRTTYRSTIIGAAAFHFRVRNGNGWDHCAGITRRLNSGLLIPGFLMISDGLDSLGVLKNLLVL